MQQMDRRDYFDDRELNREQRRALAKHKRALIASYPEKLTMVLDGDKSLPYTSHAMDLREVWRSKKFTVMVWNVPADTKISIQRNEWNPSTRRYADGITWDEIMEIKRDIGLGESTGVEFFPADTDVINIANVRHIWFFPNGAIDRILKLWQINLNTLSVGRNYMKQIL